MLQSEHIVRYSVIFQEPHHYIYYKPLFYFIYFNTHCPIKYYSSILLILSTSTLMSISPNNKPYISNSNHIYSNPSFSRMLSINNLNSIDTKVASRSSRKSPSSVTPISKHKNTDPKNVKQSLDSESNILVQKLITYRQKLSKKLHHHTVIFSLEQFNKCVKHGYYFSVYDKNTRQLLCAQCYSNKTKPSKSQYLIEQSRQQKSAQLNQKSFKEQNNRNSKQTTRHINNRGNSLIPIQKAKLNLQSDLILKKLQVENQINTIKKIQNILYEGFQNQRKQMNNSIVQLQKKYFEAIKKLQQSKTAEKQAIKKLFAQEFKKHQSVIKQLGILRKIIQDYSQNIENNLLLSQVQQQKILGKYPESPNKYSTNTPRQRRKYPQGASSATFYLQQLRSLRQDQKSQSKNKSFNIQTGNKGSDIGVKREEKMPKDSQYLKLLIYKHVIYSELISNSKFGKNENIFNQQSHNNKIKQISELVTRNVDNLIQQIQQNILHRSKK